MATIAVFGGLARLAEVFGKKGSVGELSIRPALAGQDLICKRATKSFDSENHFVKASQQLKLL
jgi:hypothetical protein